MAILLFGMKCKVVKRKEFVKQHKISSNRSFKKLAMFFDLFPHIPVAPSEFFLLLLGRLGMMTFSKSPSSVRLVVMLQIFVLVPCFPGL